MSLEVRPARESDDAALAGLWSDTGLTRPWNDPLADIALSRRSPDSELFVATLGSRLVGSVMSGSDGHRGWLYYLAVANDVRRQGLGRRLVAVAEGWLAGRGIPKAMLMIRMDNTATRDFYRRIGYHDEPRLVLARWLDGRAPPAT